MLRDRVVERLAWVGALISLATAAILLFGPLWDSAVGENPLERDPDPDLGAVLRLALPTVVVLASIAVALCAGRWRVAGAVALVIMGYAIWRAPDPLPVWFVPGLLVTALGYAVSLRHRRVPEAGPAQVPAP